MAIGIAGCTANDQIENAAESGEILPVTRLITKDTVLTREYVTNIEAVSNVEIRARVSGYLQKILVDEGQEVRKGQPLFQIDAAEYQAELAKAKANLNNTIAEAKTQEVELSKVRMLVDKKVISKTELEVAKANLRLPKPKLRKPAQRMKMRVCNYLIHLYALLLMASLTVFRSK